MGDPVPDLTVALGGRYRVERELGAGGMATIYLAEDIRHQRRVAIKVLRPDLAAAIGVDRFLREISTTASLRHPHIVPLYDSGESDGVLCYVMPFVEGESLRALSKAPADRFSVVSQFADALAHSGESADRVVVATRMSAR